MFNTYVLISWSASWEDRIECLLLFLPPALNPEKENVWVIFSKENLEPTYLLWRPHPLASWSLVGGNNVLPSLVSWNQDSKCAASGLSAEWARSPCSIPVPPLIYLPGAQINLLSPLFPLSETSSERRDFSIRKMGCWIPKSEIEHINMYKALKLFFEVWFLDWWMLLGSFFPLCSVKYYAHQLGFWVSLRTLWLSPISISITFIL